MHTQNRPHTASAHQQNMISNLKILNSRDTKQIIEKLFEQYGYEYDRTSHDYVFLMNKDNRIYLISRSIELIPYDEMKIDSIGMYFGELYKESIRLSIEGSQMIGPTATKNVVNLDTDQMNEWVKGSDIIYEDIITDKSIITNKDFIILSHKDKITGKIDYYGAGKFKDGKILNFVSKSRRLVVVNS
jgi:NOL1/NOP2/fmu family ribosome biogenesis protein